MRLGFHLSVLLTLPCDNVKRLCSDLVPDTVTTSLRTLPLMVMQVVKLTH